MAEITDEQIKDFFGYVVAHPDRIPDDMKPALAGLVTPKQVQTSPAQPLPDASVGIASSMLMDKIKDLEKKLEDREIASMKAMKTALDDQKAQFAAVMESEKERREIVSSLYKVMPRTMVDELVSSKPSMETMRTYLKMYSQPGISLAGVARGLEIQSKRQDIRTRMEKLHIPSIEFEGVME